MGVITGPQPGRSGHGGPTTGPQPGRSGHGGPTTGAPTSFSAPQSRWGLAGLLALAFVFGACSGSGGSSSGPAVVATGGEELFNLRSLGNQPGCVTCHSLTPDHVLVGPSLATIGATAGDRVPGQDGQTYIRNSIIEPNAHIVAGFEADKMPTVFASILSSNQVDALVQYLAVRLRNTNAASSHLTAADHVLVLNLRSGVGHRPASLPATPRTRRTTITIPKTHR